MTQFERIQSAIDFLGEKGMEAVRRQIENLQGLSQNPGDLLRQIDTILGTVSIRWASDDHGYLFAIQRGSKAHTRLQQSVASHNETSVNGVTIMTTDHPFGQYIIYE